MKTKLTIIGFCLLMAGSLMAGDQKNAVMAGYAFGGYGLNYERLLGERHGVMAEGVFSTSDDGTSMGGGVGYRLHLSADKGLGSTFLGLNVKYLSMDGDVTVSSGGSVVSKSPFTASLFSVVPNIGKRWIFGPGISGCFRIGYGYANANFDWSDEAAVDDLIEKAFALIGALDLELSLGYSF